MSICLRRREFIAGLGCAVAWPLATRAQQPAMPVVGYLTGGRPEAIANQLTAFRKGLSEMGYVEGRNWRSKSARRTMNSIGFRNSPPIWPAGGSPSSPWVA
jgi:hypothetical protein